MGQHFCRITIVVTGMNFERFQHLNLTELFNPIIGNLRITKTEDDSFLNITCRVYWSNNLYKLKRFARQVKHLIPEANILVGTQRLLLRGPTTTSDVINNFYRG